MQASAFRSTELILVRHGETQWNRELRFQGHIDVPLNEVGQEQARRLAIRLADEPVQYIFASDLIRASQTAIEISRKVGLPANGKVELRGQHFGQVEGMRPDEIQAAYPEAWAGWLKFEADHAMPGGESRCAFQARVMAELAHIAVAHAQKHVLIVTHGDVLDMVWRSARGLGLNGLRQCQIPNAGFNRIRLPDFAEPSRIEIVEWADTRHLAGMPAQPVYDQAHYILRTHD